MKMMSLSFLKFLHLAITVLQLGLLAPTSWGATSAEVRCIESERQALLQFKAGVVDTFNLLSSWGSDEEDITDCCEWMGVSCSNQTGHVQQLDLYALQLQGNFSSSLMELHDLRSLNLSYNSFKDSQIPEFFGSLSNLRYLSLFDCGFKGNIPSQLGSLSQLRYLDLGSNSLEGSIPYQLGNLSNLQLLDLRGNNFVGAIPHQLGNLSKLQELYLTDIDSLKTGQENGEWLSSLTSLTHLFLSNISDLKYSHNWLQIIGKLPSLQELDISSNDLSDHYILSLTPLEFNSSNSLLLFSLFGNRFTSSVIFHWLMNSSPNLVTLDLGFNLLEGPIPYEFSKVMNSLENLYLLSNKLKGGWKSLGNICTLQSLYLSNNYLSEDLPTILQSFFGCAKYSLQELYLSNNQITGTLSSNFSTFTSLRKLHLELNMLNGTIPRDLQFPSQLVTLYISSNSLKGVLTESHFANMPNLKNLDISNNSLALRFNHNWIPPFQLESIYVRSCKLGPSFPEWLKTQNNLISLDMSEAGIVDMVPEWFWINILTPNLNELDISYNNLWGTIPNFPVKLTYFPTISLASNQFEGPIPQFLRDASDLDLSKNKFSDSHMFLCGKGETKTLGILDLSNNLLSGQLPDCWSHFKSLVYLDLSGNNFSGTIPTSIGSLRNLKVMILRNNSFIGKLSFHLKSCSNLMMLDVGENWLSGPIPSWIGMELQQLKVLSLRNNQFSGSLSLHLCNLTSIQFLDLSLNNLGGEILKCFKNLTAMAQESFSIYPYNKYSIGVVYVKEFDLNAFLMWKGVEQIFKNTRLLLKGIDLSNNQLVGVIPAELGTLVELVSLNLSRNNLTGEITLQIGQLRLLEFLDLSRNHFFGPIPSSLAQIDRLTMLDLSHNNLSGKIPIGTQLQSFDASSYEENLNLCGKPLEKKCPEEEKSHKHQAKFEEDKDSLFSKGFYWSMALGFITGFWGVFGTILFNRSWRHAYFSFFSNVADTIYVNMIVNATKCKRWLKG